MIFYLTLIEIMHLSCTILKLLLLLQPFYSSLDFIQFNSGEPVPEETFTHSHLSCSSIIPYLLPPSITIYGILLVQVTYLTVFLYNLCPKFPVVCLMVWHPALHTPCISSPNHCLLFAAHAHAIATCLAVVLKLSSNPSLPLNPLLGTLF